MNQASLFYQEKYSELLNELEKVTDPSMQETHNLSIVRFLATGESPLPTLEQISSQIKSESPNDLWPQHPSWNMIHYHMALYHLCVGNYQECSNILKDLWSHIDSVDRLIVLCMSLLSIELYIRSGNSSLLDKAESFLQTHCPNQESIQSIMKNLSKLSPLQFYFLLFAFKFHAHQICQLKKESKFLKKYLSPFQYPKTLKTVPCFQ